MSWRTYDPGDTGSDPSKWDEKTVADCPQRGRQGKLDLSPSNDFGDFSETHLPEGDFYKESWSEKANASSCMLDYDDLGHTPNNEPVPQRKGEGKVNDYWNIEPSESLGGGTSGASNSRKGK